MRKKILGLDLGTNSIGWALVEQDGEERSGQIIAAGSRILPMSQDILGKFDSGQSISQTADRTNFRGIRRLRERHLLRRERLHRVLNILGFLPPHYAQQIDFDKRLGKFIEEAEPKLPYRFNAETKKMEFLFQSSFMEMVKDFVTHQPALVADGKRVPYDWTIYYLRKKALTQRIEKEELAWLLLNFNQKRGYYQLRGEEEEENKGKLVEFYSLKVTDVVATEDKKGNDTWYNVHLENGWIYRRTSKTFLDWVGKTKDFIVTTDLNEDGTVKTDKEGKEKRSFRAPAPDDWTLVKKKTESDIEGSHKTVGVYIYDSLLQNPNQKIKGKLVRVVERKFYKAELEAILSKQVTFHPELQSKALYQLCLEELYEYNEAHKSNIAQKGFAHLFINDIIFYQRPLKSKKSLISNCKFEGRTFLQEGKLQTTPLKCIARSHPLFQEFRLWQFLQNLKIYQREKEVGGQLLLDVNITGEYLKTEEDWVKLFDWLNEKREVKQEQLLKQVLKIKKVENYRWNYVEDKAYPCNETRSVIASRLAKVENVPTGFLDLETEEALWHILYSVEDKNDLLKALNTFAQRKGLGVDFMEQFKKFPPFEKEYGAFSAKALKRLLPLMRIGRYWDEAAIDPKTMGRIEKIICAEYDETIRNRVRDKAIKLSNTRDFSGLPVWLASYIVYDRHSEDGELQKWETAKDITLLEQHSLRNPIVEQVINETLQVVRDIWNQYGKGAKDFFSEIHVELGREMKNPAEKRRQITNQVTENENTNLRIKALLMELLNDKEVENVRPYSPMQQEILKIYEEGALSAAEEIPDYITKISKQDQPSQADLVRYKLWLQQRYRSPYTGEVIPLSKLFTRAYDIEHIIPQSRFFDDSFSNKVICEAEVNKDKDNSTAYEYIKRNAEKIIELSFGKKVKLFSVAGYEEFVKKHYGQNRGKMRKLLMEEIPESFIQRQLNDSRYISKVVKGLLSNIVREEGEAEATSKNVISSNGAITSILKQDWGLNDVWNELITPRFERMNELTNSKNFGEWVNKEGKNVFQIQVPLELQKGFNKKRIDHRHHALDAIVIACASRNHINYLNNENANGKDPYRPTRYDLRNKLRRLEEIQIEKLENGQQVKRTIKVAREFYKPWDSITQEVRDILSGMVVSFKQNLRVINKTVNRYQSWKDDKGEVRIDKTGKPLKDLTIQVKGDHWAIRKPMHKDTVSGLVNLRFKKVVSLSAALDCWELIVNKELRREIKEKVSQGFDKKKLVASFKASDNLWNGVDVSRVEIYYWDNENVASRVTIDESFTSDKIKSITDTGMQKILLNHLVKYNEEKNGKVTEHPELAFSADGLDDLNKNIADLNAGKQHKPVYKARIYEPLGNKFTVGQKGNKKHKYVEAAKGTNLFFAIYRGENGKRSYESIPLNFVIERQKQGLGPVPDKNDTGDRLLFHLSPNDLVYVPLPDENERDAFHVSGLSKNQLERIYKIVSFTGTRLYAIPFQVAKPVVDKVEFTQLNKLEFSLDKYSIREVCLKIKIDRLGYIGDGSKLSLFDEPGKTLVNKELTGKSLL